MAEGTKIRCRIIIEVLGKPKEHVESTIKQYVDNIKEDTELAVLSESFAETEKHEELWSTFVELEMIMEGVPKLIGFCFDYMPSSIEIIKPEMFTFKNKVIVDFLNDLQARLHKVDMVVKQLKAENDFIKKNMNTLVKNIILISLAKNKLNSEKISKVAGIPENEVNPFLESLIKENKIKKEGELYSLV